MKNRNIHDLLDKVKPPDVTLPASKAKLRRELLTDRRFNPKPSRFRRMFLKYALRTSPVFGLLLVLIIFNLIPGEMSAEARLHDLESTYRGSFVKGNVHYIKARFESSREHDSMLLLRQWRYGKDMLRIMLQNENTLEFLSHLIIKGERIYLRNDKTSGAKINVDRSCDERLDREKSPGQTSSHAYSVIVSPVEEKNENGKKMVNVIISNDSFDIFGFASQAPGDIFSRLKSDPAVTYTGAETHEGVTLDLFERKTSPEIMSFLLEYKEDLDKEISRLVENIKKQLSQPDGIEVRDGFKAEKIDVKETLKVHRHSGRIASLLRISSRRGKTIARHELMFLDEGFLPYNPALFDEIAFRLDEYEMNQNK
jgi:hypothetical protein